MALRFAVACKKYFGLLEGQPFAQFTAELKKLTPEDRKELAAELTKELQDEVAA